MIRLRARRGGLRRGAPWPLATRQCSSTADFDARVTLRALQKLDASALGEPKLQWHLRDLEGYLDRREASPGQVRQPNTRQIGIYFLYHGVPFICFGFLDNAIMILAGDAIDASLGLRFGISTFCAAAMGNMVSDISGLWLTAIVENDLPRRLPRHNLTQQQKDLPHLQFTKMMAMIVGTVTGCILGMFPLIWPNEWRLWPAPDAEAKGSPGG